MRLRMTVAAIMAAGFALPMIAGAGEATKADSMLLSQAEERFEMLDTNKDGVIDRNEAVVDPEVAAAFDEINVAGTGEITIEEFSAWEEVSESVEPAQRPES